MTMMVERPEVLVGAEAILAEATQAALLHTRLFSKETLRNNIEVQLNGRERKKRMTMGEAEAMRFARKIIE